MNLENKKLIPIFDAHQDISDMSLYIAGTDFLKKNKLLDGKNNFNLIVNNQSDYYRAKKAGLRLIFGASCVVGFSKEGKVIAHPNFLEELLRHINFYYDLEKRSRGRIKIVKSKDDLINWQKDNVMRLVLAVESLGYIDKDLVLLDTLCNLGVKYISLTYNAKNILGGGCATKAELTPLGKRVVRRMGELNMILDLAHIGKRSYFQALEELRGPVIVSHTACSKVYKHFRNINDKQIKAVAQKNGLIGICGVEEFCGGSNIEDLVKHFMHVIEIVGVDHVMIGSDFNGMIEERLIKSFKEVSDMPILLKKLMEAGLGKRDVEKIAYKNLEKFLIKNLSK